MRKMNSLLNLDFYKTTHNEQYPVGTTKIASYFTPRMSRLPFEDKVVMFGLQSFIKEFLIEDFDNNFFNMPLADILAEYDRVLGNTLGKGAYSVEKVKALHDLGYLPLEIKSLPEGFRAELHAPMLEVTNTLPEFAWLVNTIESLMSAELWHGMISATVGYWYRNIVNQAYDKTADDSVARERALGDFSFRGQECLQSAVKSSAGFALSFLNSATVPVVSYLEEYYNCDSAVDDVVYGGISTEHSVMCSNTAVDGNETDMVKRLLTEIYPNHSFSMVSDSYDYWNMVDVIIPSLKKEILAHKGCMLVRGDSGNPIDIVTETVFHLWKTFGGTVNSKGYKVLDSHVRAVYGDSITIQRCEKIYKVLEAQGFSAENAILGVGSFSMQCVELADGTLSPFTRDTFSMAIKATYCEINGKPYEIFKNPKTDSGHFKKSQKGMCVVYEEDNEIKYQDGLNFKQARAFKGNLLETTFKNGKMTKEWSLDEVRNNLHSGKFYSKEVK